MHSSSLLFDHLPVITPKILIQISVLRLAGSLAKPRGMLGSLYMTCVVPPEWGTTSAWATKGLSCHLDEFKQCIFENMPHLQKNKKLTFMLDHEYYCSSKEDSPSSSKDQEEPIPQKPLKQQGTK